LRERAFPYAKTLLLERERRIGTLSCLCRRHAVRHPTEESS
jgi:hypothetical protein